MKKMSKPFTRREFVSVVSRYGGSAFATMTALGLISRASGQGPSLDQLRHDAGRGKKVLILGAGVAGMAAAYELGKLGFECVLLEPRQRSGGRCWTVRGGDTETELSGARQTCRFAEGEYLNPGPMRIPQWHITLDYCKQFGVPIEPFGNWNEFAYYYFEGGKGGSGFADLVDQAHAPLDYGGPLMGKRVRIREAKADLRGQVSELFAKAIHQDELDIPFSGDDQDRLLEFLRHEGDLQSDLSFAGSSRRGYNPWPSGGPNPGVLEEMLPMKDLLRGGFGNYLNSENKYYWQMMMFQPVGGMDQIAKAFEKRVRDSIRFGAEVTEIRKSENGARISYRQDGRDLVEEGDYAVCTIPFPILKDIPNDLSKSKKEAIAALDFVNIGKIGLQFSERFWEDEDRIFGGISKTDLPISQIVYPSNNYLSQKGVLVGYFAAGEEAEYFGRLSPERREREALLQGSKIHPQYRDYFENAFSVDWARLKYSRGCTLHWTKDLRKRYFSQLLEPDDRIYLGGDFTTYLEGWIAGAIESGRYVTQQIYSHATS